MPSNIPTDVPAQHNPTTQSIRDAFVVANTEVSALQSTVAGWSGGGMPGAQGVMGATGATGATGVQGASGPEGPPGAAGSASSPVWEVARGSQFHPSTTSTTFDDIPDLSLTFDLPFAMPVVAWLNLTMSLAGAPSSFAGFFAFRLDTGADIGEQSSWSNPSGTWQAVSASAYWPAVSAGTHTVRARWRTANANTLTARTNWRYLLVQH